MNDVLTDPLFSVESGSQELRRYSLPELLGTLMDTGQEDPPISFPVVAPRQRGLVWRFLVRTAAFVLREEGARTVREFADRESGEISETIRGRLRAEVPESAWLLHHDEELDVPAFLQPPYSGEEELEQTGVSELTFTAGQAQHSRKATLPRDLSPEEAIYALLEYQMGSIYGGPTWYETQLTSSGRGRAIGVPFVGVEFRKGLPTDFVFAVDVLLANWDSVRKEKALKGSVWALWTESWNGETQMSSMHLSPAFIPCARIVRLDAPEEGVFRTVHAIGSDVPRVDDHTKGADLGDPFLPLVEKTNDKKKGDGEAGELYPFKVRGAPNAGYTYEEVTKTVVGGVGRIRPPIIDALGRPHLLPPNCDTIHVHFAGPYHDGVEVKAFHEKDVRLPPNASLHLHQRPGVIEHIHGRMLTYVAEVRKALKRAGTTLMGLKGDALNHKALDDLAGFFERSVEVEYLPFLFGVADEMAAAGGAVDDEEDDEDEDEEGDQEEGIPPWEKRWLDFLGRVAREALEEGSSSLSSMETERWKREVMAEDKLTLEIGNLKK